MTNEHLERFNDLVSILEEKHSESFSEEDNDWVAREYYIHSASRFAKLLNGTYEDIKSQLHFDLLYKNMYNSTVKFNSDWDTIISKPVATTTIGIKETWQFVDEAMDVNLVSIIKGSTILCYDYADSTKKKYDFFQIRDFAKFHEDGVRTILDNAKSETIISTVMNSTKSDEKHVRKLASGIADLLGEGKHDIDLGLNSSVIQVEKEYRDNFKQFKNKRPNKKPVTPNDSIQGTVHALRFNPKSNCFDFSFKGQSDQFFKTINSEMSNLVCDCAKERRDIVVTHQNFVCISIAPLL